MAAASPVIPAQTAIYKPGGLNLYSRFALARELDCSITHAVFTPVDVYVDLAFILRIARTQPTMLVRNEGISDLLTGFGPTFIGYFIR
ncbi:hypothetical protein CORC01_08671 [Colletotrichum orchidophilum]|uniref:Uncharacterized protein n=1 Tax=Colletotrichum orchidophilum TaxID=1209926 RepID=A0A1G4B3H5_9PEZI|nr:uncharacterized protein CORC01_08671 [Colletotrichum orchidophilum]OHE95978.1 hypothetical protein CORC01_08671 [Colletotrichum orchidophilum]